MGKHRPPKRRDRRTGESPYVRHEKTPYKYHGRVEVDPIAANQTPPRRGRDHVQAEIFNAEKFKWH